LLHSPELALFKAMLKGSGVIKVIQNPNVLKKI